MNDAEFQTPEDGVELNLKGKMRPKANFRGNAPEPPMKRQDTVCSTDGFSALDHVHPHRPSTVGHCYMKSLVCTEQFRVKGKELATENTMFMGNIREAGKKQGWLKSSRSLSIRPSENNYILINLTCLGTLVERMPILVDIDTLMTSAEMGLIEKIAA